VDGRRVVDGCADAVAGETAFDLIASDRPVARDTYGVLVVDVPCSVQHGGCGDRGDEAKHLVTIEVVKHHRDAYRP
jgi:hypothetical protein